jgi:hypothetical protein
VATSTSPEYLVTGKYFRDLKQIERNDTIPVEDIVLATKLWDTCEAMATPVQ